MLKMMNKIDIHTSGSLKQLGQLVEENNINITVNEIMTKMSKYVSKLSENQQIVFKAFYFRQMNVYDIYYTYKFNSTDTVIDILQSAIKNYTELLIADYGKK